MSHSDTGSGSRRFQDSSSRRATRLLARTLAVGLAALGVGLAVGACGTNSSDECSHCCSCTCTGGTCSGESAFKSDSCEQCEEACQYWCAGEGCTYVSGRSCDGERTCDCGCTCGDCPTDEYQKGSFCAGPNCDSCAGACRDVCMELGCGRVDNVSGGCTS
jgi:hypothetical protein